MTKLLEIRDLKTQFFTSAGVVRAVDGITYDVAPGETVRVTVTVVPSSGIKINRYPKIKVTVDVPEDGVVRVPFELPATIDEGRAALTLVLEDGGNVESHVERIPVSLGRLVIETFPESGDLVAGIDTRVYFRVTDPTGEPAALDADVVDGLDEPAAVSDDAHSFHGRMIADAIGHARENSVRPSSRTLDFLHDRGRALQDRHSGNE